MRKKIAFLQIQVWMCHIESWVQLFESAALSQGISDILEDSYIVKNPSINDYDLCNQVKSTFLYNMLLLCTTEYLYYCSVNVNVFVVALIQ